MDKIIKNQDVIKLAVTVDTDSDYYFGNLSNQKNAYDKTILGWEGLDLGMPLLIEQIEKISREFDIHIPITWFVRCDGQIKSQYGNHAYLLAKYDKWWSDRLKAGDDIQWHTHLYKKYNGNWIQETNTECLKKDLTDSQHAYEKLGYRFSFVRFGESYCTNQLLDIIEKLGIKAGSSAMPGRYRVDKEKNIDWRNTPNVPYHPSIENYKVPGKPERNFIEFPMNTVETQVSYDKDPIARYVNLSFHKNVIDDGIRTFFSQHNTLISITHPFEIVDKFFTDSDETTHPLLSFNPETVSKNLRNIIHIAQEMGKSLQFVKMEELL